MPSLIGGLWTISYRAYLLYQFKKNFKDQPDTVVYNLDYDKCRIAWNKKELAIFGKPKFSNAGFILKTAFTNSFPVVILSLVSSGFVLHLINIFVNWLFLIPVVFLGFAIAALTINFFDERKTIQKDFIKKKTRSEGYFSYEF